MDLIKQHDGYWLGGCHFNTYEELEEACFENPGLADEHDELCCAAGSRVAVDTYFLMAEIEYGDGNADIPDDILAECYDENKCPLF